MGATSSSPERWGPQTHELRHDVVSITIDPKAIDPDDPELLADLVLAAVNEALRSARGLMESKMSGLMPQGLGDLGGLLPGA